LGIGVRLPAPPPGKAGQFAAKREGTVPNKVQARLDDTFDYIDSIPGISPVHRARIRLDLGHDRQASGQINLGFRGLRENAQQTKRRHALQALLLCLCWSGDPDKISAAKRYYQNATEADIKDAVKSSFLSRRPTRTRSSRWLRSSRRSSEGV
jgi:hypothetical protein